MDKALTANQKNDIFEEIPFFLQFLQILSFWILLKKLEQFPFETIDTNENLEIGLSCFLFIILFLICIIIVFFLVNN